MSNTRKLTLAIVVVVFMQGLSYGSIQEVDDLNIIDMAGNPSDGLGYLDLSYSYGFTLAAALSNAQAVLANPRVATPEEFDDLFAAAGIVNSDPLLSASAGFLSGGNATIDSGPSYVNSSLRDILGARSGYARMWTDPDGSVDPSTTRDFVQLGPLMAEIQNTAASPPHGFIGWLIVSGSSTTAVPEASSLLVWLGLGMLGCQKLRRPRKTRL